MSTLLKASSSSSLNLLLLCFFSALFISINGVVVFPVIRDLPTGQYVAKIRVGYSSDPVNLVVDLGGPILWFGCSSSSRSLISESSSDCLKAKVANNRVSSRDQDEYCDLLVRNSAVGVSARGELAREVFSFGSDSSPRIVDLLVACAPPWLLRGLASGAQGVMGLGKAQISLPLQLAAETNERRRLTVYLSPLNGVVSTNSVEEVFGAVVSRSLVYTPLSTGSSGNYVINVKSIRVNGKKLSVDGPLTAELNTMVPYTMLEDSIYALFADAYAKSATNAISVTPIAPFGLCFKTTTEIDLDFPAVDMALQSEMVRWRIQGRNLMVDVGGGVQCLGIVNGGSNRVSPIIMGGLQLEGFVLDFDLGNSMMGFGLGTSS